MENKYRVGNRVYYNLPEAQQGLILNIRYYPKEKEWEYLVTWGPGETDWYSEEELAKEKVIV